jgi:hypothetical protein
MANIVVSGNCAVIKSTAKLEELERLEKYAPNALVLFGGEDGKEPVFRLGVSKNGNGSVDRFGALFDATTTSADGFATITMALCSFDGDLKEFLADQLGASLRQIAAIEESIPGALDQVNADRAAVMSQIEIV